MNSFSKRFVCIRSGWTRFGVLAATALTASKLAAADPVSSDDAKASAEEREKALLKDVRVPDGFEATIFAAPPAVNYPVFVAAAPDGALFVSSDKNGSLDRKPNRGSVVRLRDLDGDGRADESKRFIADVDTPRGLVWDQDRLYLLHPPHLSAFIDKDGDGVADETKGLVKNIAFTFKDRPGDHSSNGLELGMDGWIYCAIGDFGFMEAEGLDGRKLQLRGGGVVRVRPDGTGLELFSRGTRNILEVAVSPLLDAFARDNTNDGGGWDIRLHHFTGLSEHGYPSLFKNFNEEIVAPLADYGGGSGCGALFLSEPGFPAEYNDALYTADWGREWVYRHHLTPKGATFAADQAEFVRVPRVTDLDVDASSRIYIASWKGASFTYVGENVGYIVRVTPKGFQPAPLPDFVQATEAGLVRLLESPSHRRRLAAQRELIRRGMNDGVSRALKALAQDGAKPLASRVAALFAVKQGLRANASGWLAELTKENAIRQYALRASTDRLDELAAIPTGPILAALRDHDASVRREAAFSVARLGSLVHGPSLAGLLADPDPTVAHSAMRGLIALQASDACFAVLDRADAPSVGRAGVLRVLQSLHAPGVVDGLLNRLHTESDPSRRWGLLTALCRLHFKEGVWKGDSWATRPDTSGPYYQPESWTETPKIARALTETLIRATDDEGAFLVTELSRHKIYTQEALHTVIGLATKNPALIPAAIGQLSRGEGIPPDAVPLLVRAANSDDTNNALRSQTVIALAKSDAPDAFKAIPGALARLPNARGQDRESRLAREAFLNSSWIEKERVFLEQQAVELEPASVWADAALLTLSERKAASPESREQSGKAIETGWSDLKRRAQILRAVALAGHRPYAEKVLASLEDSDAGVVAAAKQTATALRLDRSRAARRNEPVESPLGTMPPDAMIAAALNQKGDATLGEQVFLRQACAACHTVRADDPPRGPFLGNIATLYKRPELAEAIVMPGKTIAQGFATHTFDLKDGESVEGFVTLEAADKVTIRNATGLEIQIPAAHIAKRAKLDRSMMPDGLAAALTLREFASLLDYLESLAKK